MSEVPLGTLLSGGLDSGTLTALVVEGLVKSGGVEAFGGETRANPATSPSPAVTSLKTISIGFDRPGYDESHQALDLAQYLNTDHHPTTFTAADFDDYATIMRHLEEPQCYATCVPIYRLYQACRTAGLTVVLTGEGADELLGGYFWHRGDALMRPLLNLPQGLRRALAAAPLGMSPPARRVLRRGSKSVSARYRDWLEVNGEAYRQQLLSADASPIEQDGANQLLLGWDEMWLNGVPQAAPLHQTLWLESRTRMIDFINFEVDKMSMAHSIEARVPFLDHKLWEFCAGLPAEYKLKRGVEKHLLREATKDLLPVSTRVRRKKGLAAPYNHWLQRQQLPDWAEAALSVNQLKQVGLFNPATVQTLRRAHQTGRSNLGSLLMGVLSTQVWAREFRI